MVVVVVVVVVAVAESPQQVEERGGEEKGEKKIKRARETKKNAGENGHCHHLTSREPNHTR